MTTHEVKDLAVIGAGPAGLSAAVYATRAGLTTTVYQGETLGGLLTTTDEVDNYLGLPNMTGPELAAAFVAHTKKLGADFAVTSIAHITRNTDGVFKLEGTRGEMSYYRAVILATGSEPRKLEIPGEELAGVSWCAVCDGSFSEDEEVIIVGGGESAVEEALYMSNIASKVTVLVRSDAFRATRPAVENMLSRPNVEVRYNAVVAEILGEDDAVVGVRLEDDSTIEAYSVFETIGQIPQSQLAESHASICANGFIQHANTPGFFVAGDVADPEYRQVAVAVGDGAKAGIDAIRWLQQS